jgi:hypothetical protein
VPTYDLLDAPGLLSGDVLLSDENGLGDVIRFNSNEVFSNGDAGALLFYSDRVDGFDALGDTPSPPGAFYPNIVHLSETGTEDNNGATYTPTPGQPGFILGVRGTLTYDFISDGNPVPEPASVCLAGLGFLGAAGYSWRRRARNSG